MSDIMDNITTTSDGITDDSLLLHVAIIEENPEVVKFLLKHGFPVNARAMNRSLAAEFPSDIEHQKFIDNATVETTTDSDSEELQKSRLPPISMKTVAPLHLAARNEDPALAEILLLNNAKVDAVMEGGETPLIIAVMYKCYKMAKLMLEYGANANAKTLWGKTALHYAAQTNQITMVELLLGHSGCVNMADIDGLTPLHMAASAGCKEIVATLLKHGADLDAKTKAGASTLHYAVVMGHKNTLEFLIRHGADINCIMKNGSIDLSAFRWVTSEEEKKIWDLVFKYSSKMNIANWCNTMISKLYKKSKERKGKKAAITAAASSSTSSKAQT